MVVVEPEGRETSLDKEAVLSVALFERLRLKGLRWAKDAMELRRLTEVRLDSEDGATSLDKDLRVGILVPFEYVPVGGRCHEDWSDWSSLRGHVKGFYSRSRGKCTCLTSPPTASRSNSRKERANFYGSLVPTLMSSVTVVNAFGRVQGATNSTSDRYLPPNLPSIHSFAFRRRLLPTPRFMQPQFCALLPPSGPANATSHVYNPISRPCLRPPRSRLQLLNDSARPQVGKFSRALQVSAEWPYLGLEPSEPRQSRSLVVCRCRGCRLLAKHVERCYRLAGLAES